MATSRFRLHPTLLRIQPSRFYALPLFRRPEKLIIAGLMMVSSETRLKFSGRWEIFRIEWRSFRDWKDWKDGNCVLCLNYVIRVTIDRQRSILEARLERNFDRKGERVGEQVLLARIYLLNDPQLSSNINGNLVGGNGRKKFVEKHGKIFPSFVRTNFHQDRIIPLWERSIKHCPYFLKLVNKKVVRTFTLAQGNDPKIKPVISVQRFSLWDSLQRISRKRE